MTTATQTEAPTVPTVELLPTAPAQYDLALAGRRAGTLLRLEAGAWMSALRAVSGDGALLAEDRTHDSLGEANHYLRTWTPGTSSEPWTGHGPTITGLRAYPPGAGEPEIHFGFVPSGGRVACGGNRYHSTLVTETRKWITCQDCDDEVTRLGSAKVARELRLQGS